MTPPGSSRKPKPSLADTVGKRMKSHYSIMDRREVNSIAKVCGVSAEDVRGYLASSGFELTKSIGGRGIWKRETQKRKSLSGRYTNVYKSTQS
jgi:hypothetical protein